ncbi:hypothetical protein [Chromobacterium sphagni]|uniref:UDP-N-acetylglucosamine kinase n=1 Tax=Chromobacterium sphagni TaxID=1903179 RepID=A0ABX3CBM1_9NEIS|nr:hypothetical protein [Chromobacterium sphagni]OHX19700.1 hypothetical protein BI344_17240 [Chromobacterium sphagni]
MSARLLHVGQQASSQASALSAPTGLGGIVSTDQVAELILDRVKQKRQPNRSVVIFIAGPSASGKSALTGALQQRGLRFEPVKTDHFLKSFSQLAALPANHGLPVAEWPVVHGHADSFNRALADDLLQAISAGREFSYSIPANYREGVMIGGYPRGERDASGPHRQVGVPACDTYLIEGISTPHLVRDASQVLVRLDCDFDETVKRRAGRGHDSAIPAEVRVAEDRRQYEVFQQAMDALGGTVAPDIALDSSGMSAGHFQLRQAGMPLPLLRARGVD